MEKIFNQKRGEIVGEKRYKTSKSTETSAPFGIGLFGTYKKVEIKDTESGHSAKGFDNKSMSKAEAEAWKILQSKNEKSGKK